MSIFSAASNFKYFPVIHRRTWKVLRWLVDVFVYGGLLYVSIVYFSLRINLEDSSIETSIGKVTFRP